MSLEKTWTEELNKMLSMDLKDLLFCPSAVRVILFGKKWLEDI